MVAENSLKARHMQEKCSTVHFITPHPFLHMHMHGHTQTHTHMHGHTHIPTHTCTYTHTHTHTCTDTHTENIPYSVLRVLKGTSGNVIIPANDKTVHL